MRRRRWPQLALVVVPLLVAMSAALSPAAENFVCGPGGSADPKTAKCICPPGKLEKTTGGTSRCVDKPNVTPPKPTASTSTPSKPPVPPITSTTAPPLPPMPSCAPSQIATPAGCIERCTPDQVWSIDTCVSRCRADEVWNGATCAKRPSMPGIPPPVYACTDGKVIDSTGHCCFAGQVWGESSGRCRGVPQCPPGYLVAGESCALSSCLPGMQRVGDGLHCCWPGQEWSGATMSCVGVPSCPDGYSTEAGDRCVPLRLCDPGKVAVDIAHCCYLGQHWMLRADGEAGCGGAPQCPTPLVVRGEDCVSPDQLTEQTSHSDATAKWGVGAFTIESAYSFGSGSANANAKLTLSGFDVGAAYHISGIPLRIDASVFIGSAKYPSNGNVGFPSETSVTATGWTIGAAFAPFSIPNALTTPVSLFNPWAGVRYRTYSYGVSFEANDTAHPDGGHSVELHAGNILFLSIFGITVDFAYAPTGGDNRPLTVASLGIAYLIGRPH